MENHTFRSRLIKLVQKSRKALRLYTTMGRMKTSQAEFTELQIAEWKEVNACLVRQLSSALEQENAKKLAVDIVSLRDRFYSDWRETESKLHVKQKELIAAAEHGDFVKAVVVSKELVLLKAKVQASQAAHHELQDVIKQSRISVPTIELSTETAIPDDKMTARVGNVIPLRR